jgi:DNA polymerase-1
MLLQVHDELVFEIETSDAEKAAAWVKEEMENIIKLEVPLLASVFIVNSWGEAK